MSKEEVSMGHLLRLLKTHAQAKLNGLNGGTFTHHTFGLLQIDSWEPGSKNSIRLKTVDDEGKRRTFSSRGLPNLTVTLATGPLSTQLLEQCKLLSEIDQQQRLKAQLEETQRLEKERLASLARRARVEALREQERQAQIQEEIESRRRDEEQRKEQLRRTEERRTYEQSLIKIAHDFRDRVRAKFPPVVPHAYDPPIHTLVKLAVDWFDVRPPDKPNHIKAKLRVDRFLADIIDLWNTGDLWKRRSIIQILTKHEYFVEALQLSFALEQSAVDPKLRQSVRISRLRTLSMCGLAEEADLLGRQMYMEQNGLDKFLAFTLWGHYRRWPFLDKDQKIRHCLSNYFDEIQEWPKKVDGQTSRVQDDQTKEEMRRLLSV